MQYYCGYCSAMCPIMDWKASWWIPSKFFLHIYSGKYVSNRVECIVLVSRIIRLHDDHILSTCWV